MATTRFTHDDRRGPKRRDATTGENRLGTPPPDESPISIDEAGIAELRRMREAAGSMR